MAARKLQQEMDKTFKKVAEGREAFSAIYEKMQECDNMAQKEKLEDNLKREIKKLQRLRDQIKTWAAGNDIKDKKPLMDQRKAIEADMETFKAVEKEMKTKAFSKEGLQAAAKLDPKEKEKLETAQFLQEMVEELERQIEGLEAEEESLQVTAKKGKKDTSKVDRVSQITKRLDQHKWHVGKLELLLRALENGNVTTDQITSLKEDIRYYVEENSATDFQEDEALYEDLNLEQDEEAWGMNADAEGSQQDAQSVAGESPEEVKPAPVPPVPKPVKTAAPDPPVTNLRRPSNAIKSPLPALASLHAPLPTPSSIPPPSNMKPAPLPARPAGEPLKYASAAAAAAVVAEKAIAPLPTAPTTANTQSPVPAKAELVSQSAPQPPPVAPSISAVQQQSMARSSTPSAVPASAIDPRSDLTAQSVASSSIPPTPALERAETASHTTKSRSPLTRPQTIQETSSVSPDSNRPLTPRDPYVVSDQTLIEDEESIYHLPSDLQELISSFEITKSATEPIGSQRTQRLLNASQNTCPDAFDAERPRSYTPLYKYNAPKFYPQEQATASLNPDVYNNMDTDTLFFVFYYMQGTYQQHLAARALKAQSWRFHKQYQTWFQRHEEPKTITEEYEQGTYRFFDYESTWMNRRKADFKFAYKFLEDDQ